MKDRKNKPELGDRFHEQSPRRVESCRSNLAQATVGYGQPEHEISAQRSHEAEKELDDNSDYKSNQPLIQKTTLR